MGHQKIHDYGQKHGLNLWKFLCLKASFELGLHFPRECCDCAKNAHPTIEGNNRFSSDKAKSPELSYYAA